MVNGTALADLGGRAQFMVRSLTLAGEALAAGLPIPAEAASAMERNVIPPWLYVLMGGMGWRMRARRHRAGGRLHDRPYAEKRSAK
jgi:hypothetical protein